MVQHGVDSDDDWLDDSYLRIHFFFVYISTSIFGSLFYF